MISVGAVLESSCIDLLGWSIRQAGFIQTALVAAGMLLLLYALFGGGVP